MSVLMNTVRVERRLMRAGRARARLDGRVLIGLACMCAVFACAYALGRASSGATAPRAEALSSIPVTPVSAAIPVHLSTAPPLEQEAPPPPPPKPKTKPAAPAATTPAPVLATPAPAPQTAAPEVSAPVSRPAPAPAPKAAPAPKPAPKAAPAPAKTPSGSFESSG
jgi:rare lipoprotein A